MTLKDRVQQRIKELDESPITLARSVGLERGYINDIIIGRKSTVRGDKLALVAKALRCDPSFLTEENPAPKMLFDVPGIRVLGICESGVWRDRNVGIDGPQVLPIAPDARFPYAMQGAFILRGYHSWDTSQHLTAGIAIEFPRFEQSIRPAENGMLVVVRREKDRLAETALRMVETGRTIRLLALSGDKAAGDPIECTAKGTAKGTAIVAVITSVIQLVI